MSDLLNELNKLQLIKVGRLHNKDQKQANLKAIKQLEKTTKEKLGKDIKMLKTKNYVNTQYGTKESIKKELLEFASKENIERYHSEVGGKQLTKIEKRKADKDEKAEKDFKERTKKLVPKIEKLKQQLAYIERNPDDKNIIKRMKEIITGKSRKDKLAISKTKLSKFTISYIVKKLPKLTKKIKDLLDIDLTTFKLVPIEIKKKSDEKPKEKVIVDYVTKKEIEKFEKDLAKELEDPEKFNELFGDLPKPKKEKPKPEPKPKKEKPKPEPKPEPKPKKEKPKPKAEPKPDVKPTSKKDQKIKDLQDEIKKLDKLINKQERIVENLELLPFRGTSEQKKIIIKENERIENERIRILNKIADAIDKRQDLRIQITDLEEGVDKDEEARKKKVGIKYAKKILKVMNQYIEKPSKKLDKKIDKLYEEAEEEQEGATEEIIDYLEEEEAETVEEFDDVKEEFDKNIII